MLLLACVQAAADALPEVPHLGAALYGTRMAEVRAEHAPKLLDAKAVAGVAEAGSQEKAGEVQPSRLVIRARLDCQGPWRAIGIRVKLACGSSALLQAWEDRKSVV